MAMITTKGFRDIVEMRLFSTDPLYEAFIPPYATDRSRYLRFTVEEKTKYNGEIVKRVDEEELKTGDRSRRKT